MGISLMNTEDYSRWVARLEQAFTFTGPDECLMELKCNRKTWSLLVNGLMVEEYGAIRKGGGDQSLRQLRSMPEGSYMIAPTFDAGVLDLHIIRKWRCVACGEVHEIQLAHAQSWQVVVDGALI